LQYSVKNLICSRSGSSSTAKRQQLTTKQKDIVDKSALEYQSTSTTNISTARQEQLTPIKQQHQKYAHDSSPDSVTKPRQSRPKAKSDHSKYGLLNYFFLFYFFPID